MVLDLFKGGVRQYGLPSRTGSDLGLENLEVACFMIEERSVGRGSTFTGKFVHNVRVERLHRDVCIGVLSHFSSTFDGFERGGLLNPDIKIHVYALHFIFIPKINRALNELPISGMATQLQCSTAQSFSPEQLFISGTFTNGYSPSLEGVEVLMINLMLHNQ